MLTVRIIPCLDCRDGRVVKGVRFSGLRDAGDPAELSALYEEQGADEIVLLDISATLEGRKAQLKTIRAVRSELSIPLTVGGGVRDVDDAGRLLDAGADKVSINSAAVKNPALLSDISKQYGSQCTVLALDAATGSGGYEVVINSGNIKTGLCAKNWALRGMECGAGEILLTSWDKDGTKSGYDLELIKEISDYVNIPVIASGGAAGPEHLLEAIKGGADAVLAASIFHYGEFTVGDVKRYLDDHGVNVRL